MKKSIAVVLICLTCMIPAFSNGQKESAAKSYVFASDCTWPPLEFVDEHGEIVGFEIDLIKEFSAMTGIPNLTRGEGPTFCKKLIRVRLTNSVT